MPIERQIATIRESFVIRPKRARSCWAAIVGHFEVKTSMGFRLDDLHGH